MRFLYVTDLHGNEKKYRAILELAREREVTLVVNGGDMLPKGGDMHADQARFLDTFLDAHLAEYDAAGIQHICCLGNDDLRVHDEPFAAMCERHPLTVNLAQARIEFGGYEWIGMNWVDDYPFRLKDRCRLDAPDATVGVQLGTALLSRPNGFDEVEDWEAYVETLPSIEHELADLPEPGDPERTVYVIHAPPVDLGLDVCAHGQAVGSHAVRRFIEARQPLLTLHGHIHESPEMSAAWRNRLGRTWCVQPGQLGRLAFALIDLASMKMERIVA